MSPSLSAGPFGLASHDLIEINAAFQKSRTTRYHFAFAIHPSSSGLRSPEANLSIFVVDDDPAALNSLRFLLESEGYHVVEFESGLDLLGRFPGAEPSCVIIDYKMPIVNGLEVFLRLRELKVNTPIILVTGHPDPSIRRRARAAGVELIDKPLSQDRLLAAIRAAGERKAPGVRRHT